MGDRLCLSDYVLPKSAEKRDHVAIFVVTAGEGVRERSEAAKKQGTTYDRKHWQSRRQGPVRNGCTEGLARIGDSQILR